MKFIKKFSQISIDDINLVGGKNASLGQMINQLSDTMINIPNGFATTAASYWYFIKSNNLESNLKKLVSEIKNHQDIKTLTTISNKIRKLIEQASIPEDLKQEISLAYQELSQQYKTDTCSVALRSSATAEDLPNASFAGQQDSFLNIEGIENILSTYKKCISSLFTPRAIAYRIEQGFDHFDVALSVGIQKMVDAKAAGVAFTLDTETGFKNVVMINSAWGLGETVVKGEVNPDSYYIFKPTFLYEHNLIK